ncbi:MAG: hypothetical protein IPI93_11955 [Sphingobacteriaceae bacterium]|nr:hypothetical protein [Sphingobacteriaceae bacterium]
MALENILPFLKRYADYSNDAKRDPAETIKYVISIISQFDPNKFEEHLYALCDIYGAVTPEYGIQFINNNLPELNDSRSKIHLIRKRSNLYIKKNKLDDAFKYLEEAGQLYHQLDLFSALLELSETALMRAKIGRLENKTDVYLTYIINHMVYDVAHWGTHPIDTHSTFFNFVDHIRNGNFWGEMREEYFIKACSEHYKIDLLKKNLVELFTKELFPAFYIDNKYCDYEKMTKEY